MTNSWPLSGERTPTQPSKGASDGRVQRLRALRRRLGAGSGGLIGNPLRIREDRRSGRETPFGKPALAEGIADSARNEQRHAAMGARQPGGGQRMGLVDMDEVEAAGGEQLANFPSCEKARSAVGDLMDADAGFGASSGQGGTACREQLGGVAAFVQTLQ